MASLEYASYVHVHAISSETREWYLARKREKRVILISEIDQGIK